MLAYLLQLSCPSCIAIEVFVFWVQARVKENGHASLAGDDMSTVFAWFDDKSSLRRLAVSMAKFRVKVGCLM